MLEDDNACCWVHELCKLRFMTFSYLPAHVLWMSRQAETQQPLQHLSWQSLLVGTLSVRHAAETTGTWKIFFFLRARPLYLARHSMSFIVYVFMATTTHISLTCSTQTAMCVYCPLEEVTVMDSFIESI